MSVFQVIRRLTFQVSLLTLLVPAAHGREADCPAARSLALNDVVRVDRSAPEEATAGAMDLYSVVAEVGVLAFHTSAPDSAGTPRLVLLSSPCGVSVSGLDVVRETPRSSIVHVRQAQTLYVGVLAEDPARPLHRYRLWNAFAAESGVVGETTVLWQNPPASCNAPDLPAVSPEPLTGSGAVRLQRDIAWTKDVEPWDCDVVELTVPEPSVVVLDTQGVGTPLRATFFDDACDTSGRSAEGALAFGSVASALVMGTHRMVLEPLEDGPVSYDLRLRHFAVCAGVEADDHGDAPFCASRLDAGVEASGTIDGAVEDDEDYFTFRLHELQSVHIEVDGAIGEIYDRTGQRLSPPDACQDGSAIVRTLAPGRYYLRVRGASGAGYTVRWTDRPSS